MDKVGTIHGDLWSEMRNRHSRRLYLILTQLDLGSDTWVTHMFARVEKKVLFGLLTFTVMDFNRPLVTFRRKTQAEATHLHARIRGIVKQEKEDDWCAFLPSSTPPEGYTEAAQHRRSKPCGHRHTPKKRVKTNRSRRDTRNASVEDAAQPPTTEPYPVPAATNNDRWAPVAFVVSVKGDMV